MKPTPRDLALLMSAVGLLSLPAHARAQWVDAANPELAYAAANEVATTSTASTAAALPAVEITDHDRQAMALAMVLMVDSSAIRGGAAAAEPDAAAESAPMPPLRVSHVQRAKPPRQPRGVVADGQYSRRAPTVAPDEGLGAHSKGDAADDVVIDAITLGASLSQIDHSATSETPVTGFDRANGESPTERVITLLGDFRSAQPEPEAGFRSPETHAEREAIGVLQFASNAPGELSDEPALRVESGLTPRDDAAARRNSQHWSERAPIIVGSHADKILLSLAAVRSGAGPQSGRLGAQTKAMVVVGHSDRVLLDLASIRAARAHEKERDAAPADDAVSSYALPASAQGLALPAAADLPERQERASVDAVPASDTGSAASPEKLAAHAGRERSVGSTGGLTADQVVAVSADRLDSVRGGFVTGNGLQISFGIERAVYLNGNLVTTTSLNLSEMGKITAGQGLPTAVAEMGRTLLQTGSGNTFMTSSTTASAIGTVIQNTLDNQKIQTVTRIDAAVTAASALRSLDLQSSLRSAITNSLHR